MEEKKMPEGSQRYMALIGQFFCINKLHKRAVESYAERNKLQKNQHRMLLMMNGMGSGVSQKDIAARMNLTPAAVAVTIKKMEKAGVVEKKIDEKDNRFNQIYITAKGQEIVKQSKEAFSCIDAAAFAGVTDEEIERLSSILSKISQNLEKMIEEEDK